MGTALKDCRSELVARRSTVVTTQTPFRYLQKRWQRVASLRHQRKTWRRGPRRTCSPAELASAVDDHEGETNTKWIRPAVAWSWLLPSGLVKNLSLMSNNSSLLNGTIFDWVVT